MREQVKAHSLPLSLNLHNHLFDTFPTGLFEFTQLSYLNLSGNQLKELPADLSRLKLSYLVLDHNKFEKFPISLCDVTTLKTLVLDSNNFPFIPESISQLTSLERFGLSYTPLRTLPNSMQRLEKLSEIGLTNCCLENYSLSQELAPMLTKALKKQGRSQFDEPQRCIVNASSSMTPSQRLIDDHHQYQSEVKEETEKMRRTLPLSLSDYREAASKCLENNPDHEKFLRLFKFLHPNAAPLSQLYKTTMQPEHKTPDTGRKVEADAPQQVTVMRGAPGGPSFG